MDSVLCVEENSLNGDGYLFFAYSSSAWEGYYVQTPHGRYQLVIDADAGERIYKLHAFTPKAFSVGDYLNLDFASLSACRRYLEERGM